MADKKQEIDPELLKALEEVTQDFSKPPSVNDSVQEAMQQLQQGESKDLKQPDQLPPGFPFMPPNMDQQGMKSFEDLLQSEEFKKAT